jgi:hypothetical protein
MARYHHNERKTKPRLCLDLPAISSKPLDRRRHRAV